MRIFRRELLERIPRPLLVRILAPYDAFFSDGGVSLSDLAATAFLEHPDAFARARRAGESPTVLGFSEFNAVSHRAARDASEACNAIEGGLRPWLVGRGRTGLIELHLTERGDVLHVEIEHGRPPATDDIVGDALERTQVTVTRTERAHFILDRAKSRLAVHAAHPAIKDLLRRLVGEHFYGDPDHFRRSGIYTLAPLGRDLDEALTYVDVPGIEGVALVGIIILLPAERITREAVGVPDLRASPREAELRSALAAGGVAEWCKLRVKLAGRKRVALVEIEPSKKKMPGTGEVARILDELLVARGFVALDERRIVIESEAPEEAAAESSGMV